MLKDDKETFVPMPACLPSCEAGRSHHAFNRSALVAMVSLLLTVTGCGGSNSSNGDGDKCKTGCVGTKFVDCEAETEENCEYGCADNICHHEPSGCTPGSESCADNVHVTCSSTGVLTTEPCPYGCNGSECASKQTSQAQPCKGVVCANGGQCDRGICVTNDMKNVQEGDDCDAWFQGFCSGNQRVTCDGGKIHYTDCTEVGGCAMSKGRQEACGGETYLFPTCRKDGPQCLDINKNGYCAIENNQGKTEAHAYGIACWENTDDTYSGNRMSDSYALCTLGCNHDKTGCLSRCEQNDALHLYNDTIQYCANNADICVTLDGEGTCGEPCHQKGLETQQCFSNNARHRVCSADDNGKLYFQDTICGCDHGCESATGLCKKIVPDEYQACDWNTFKQRCDGKIRVACVEGRVRAEECSQTCETFHGSAVCPSHICSSTESYECTDYDHLKYTKCAPADSGRLIPVQSSNTECSAGCDYESNSCYCKETDANWCTVNNEVAWCNLFSSWREIGSWNYSSCNEKICAGGSCYAKVFDSQQDCERYAASKKCPALHLCRPVQNSSQYGIWDEYGNDINCGDHVNVEWCGLTYMSESVDPNGELEAYVQVYAPGVTGANGTHDDLGVYFSYIELSRTASNYMCDSNMISIRAQRNPDFHGEGSDANDEYFVRVALQTNKNTNTLKAGFYRRSDVLNQTLKCDTKSKEQISCDLYGGNVCSSNSLSLNCYPLDIVNVNVPKVEWCKTVYDQITESYYVEFYIPGITGKQRRDVTRGSDISVVYNKNGGGSRFAYINSNFDVNYETNNDEFMVEAGSRCEKGYFTITYNGVSSVKCGINGVFTVDDDSQYVGNCSN